jgi:hypothetical protein
MLLKIIIKFNNIYINYILNIYYLYILNNLTLYIFIYYLLLDLN